MNISKIQKKTFNHPFYRIELNSPSLKSALPETIKIILEILHNFPQLRYKVLDS